MSEEKFNHKIHKIVLTGGPCAGKTTGQLRLSKFFENYGWKVFRVPETASVLLAGGIKFADLNAEEATLFQENLVRTMIQIEKTYFQLAKTSTQDCMIICDRGVMDASAYLPSAVWEEMCRKHNWLVVRFLDGRYDQVVHLVSAAIGAEEFYTVEEHKTRSEGIAKARELDGLCSAAWIGHSHLDLIDNSTNFEQKMHRLIECVCTRVGIGNGFENSARNRKYLVELIDPNGLPRTGDFHVVTYYLASIGSDRYRIQKRTHDGKSIYVLTVFRAGSVEARSQLSRKAYITMQSQADPNHCRIQKRELCFLYQNRSFQLDIYEGAGSSMRCRNITILKMFTSMTETEVLQSLPPCIRILMEVTDNPDYTMFGLSLKS